MLSLMGRRRWQRHPVIWAQQRNPLPSFIAGSWGASTSLASVSFSFLFLLSHSLLLFLCLILALIAQQFGASMHLHNQKLRILSYARGCVACWWEAREDLIVPAVLGHRRWAVAPSFPSSDLHPVLLRSLVWSLSAGRGYSIWRWNSLCYPDLACEA